MTAMRSPNRASGICVSRLEINMQLNLTSWSPSVRLDHTVKHVKARLPSVVLLAGVVACHDLSGLAGTQSYPSGTPNPNVYHTAAGALALYQNTLSVFQGG